MTKNEEVGTDKLDDDCCSGFMNNVHSYLCVTEEAENMILTLKVRQWRCISEIISSTFFKVC